MDEEKPQIKMGKVVVSKTSCVLSLVILILMCACVALLVFVLKGEKYAESLELEDHQDLPDFQADEPQLEPPKEKYPWEHSRLPLYIAPMHYDLLLRPNLTTDLFTGKANITVDVSQKTKYFIVHTNHLNVLETRLFDMKGGSEITIEKSFMYPKYQYFVVETNNTVDSGIYRLYFEFQGSLAEKIIGFYKSSYKNGNETRLRTFLGKDAKQKNPSAPDVEEATNPLNAKKKNKNAFEDPLSRIIDSTQNLVQSIGKLLEEGEQKERKNRESFDKINEEKKNDFQTLTNEFRSYEKHLYLIMSILYYII